MSYSIGECCSDLLLVRCYWYRESKSAFLECKFFRDRTSPHIRNENVDRGWRSTATSREPLGTTRSLLDQNGKIGDSGNLMQAGACKAHDALSIILHLDNPPRKLSKAQGNAAIRSIFGWGIVSLEWPWVQKVRDYHQTFTQAEEQVVSYSLLVL